MPDKQNVLFLVLDSLRKDRTSIYNDEIDFTPTLDNLAESSIIYRNAVSQAPWTLPSTASMFTGEYPWEHGANNKNLYLNYDGKTMAERFKEESFHTKAITPNMLISPSVGTADGFENVDNLLGLAGKEPFKTITAKATQLFNYIPNDIRSKLAVKFDDLFSGKMEICKSEETVERTKNFLNNVGDKDFFLFVNVMAAHEPYKVGEPPQDYLDKHGVEDIDKVPNTGREFFELDEDEYSIEDLERAYDAAVEFTDDLVGEINQSLKENNLDENTVFVVLSDHGQAVGKDKVFGHHFTVMDRVTEVPLMIKEPGQEESKTENSLFELRQLYDLIPYIAGIGEEPEEVNDIKGGYEFPETIRGIIPSDLQEKYDRKFRFVKTESQKVVKSETSSGKIQYEIKNYGEKEGDYTDKELKEKVDNVEDDQKAEERDKEKEEEVKKKLEDLGYV